MESISSDHKKFQKLLTDGEKLKNSVENEYKIQKFEDFYNLGVDKCGVSQGRQFVDKESSMHIT